MGASCIINVSLQSISEADLSFRNRTDMHMLNAGNERIVDFKTYAIANQTAPVAHLPARFGVKRCAIQDNYTRITGADTFYW